MHITMRCTGTNYAPQTCASLRSVYHMFVPLRWSRDRGVRRVKNMATIECETTINASPDLVYRVSQDYSVRYQWDPFPERIELLNGAESIEKGTKAFVVAKTGLKMEVVFVQVAPPTTATIKMTKGPFFISSFAGSWIFKAGNNGSTDARFVYSVKIKKWAFPFVSNAIASWYFSGVVKRRLSGLKAYCEGRA